ncbi:MAG: hypothetical protein J6X34_02740, partial [Clostridia bacterium]|nr:hypothetical protein [Clostridia bacterium]
SMGSAFWTEDGDVWIDKQERRANVGAGKIYQGLYVEKGEHEFTALVSGKGRIFAEDALMFETVSQAFFDAKEPAEYTLKFTLDEDRTLALGIYEGTIYNARIDGGNDNA